MSQELIKAALAYSLAHDRADSATLFCAEVMDTIGYSPQERTLFDAARRAALKVKEAAQAKLIEAASQLALGSAAPADIQRLVMKYQRRDRYREGGTP